MDRTVVVIDRDLPKGLAANAAAVLALTTGARRPELVGDDFSDAEGSEHPGLITTGLPVLAAPAEELSALRASALDSGLLVVALPAAAQTTTDYAVFREAIATTSEPAYLALLVSGRAKAVRALTGSLALLR